MRIGTIIRTTILLSAFIFTSCSNQLVPAEKPHIHSQFIPFHTENLLPEQQLAFADYTSKPVEFFNPPVRITKHFNQREQRYVRVEDDKLFEKNSELVINFGDITEDAFAFPLPNARVISPYGIRHRRNHTGIDIKTFANDTIRAAFNGIIRVAGKSRGYGNVIVIRHYNGLETVYGHNSRFLVQSGDKVTAGTPIALEGRTGRATTDHLHFEIRVNGQPFDPNLIIDFANRKLHNKCVIFTPNAKGKISIDQV